MSKPYRFTKIVYPGWEKVNQRAYLVINRETDQPLGRVHDQTLWNLYDPHGENWVTAHSDEDLDGKHYSTRSDAAAALWRAHKIPSVSPEKENFLPSGNLKYAANFDHESFAPYAFDSDNND